jgi:hypothetical protein
LRGFLVPNRKRETDDYQRCQKAQFILPPVRVPALSAEIGFLGKTF